MRITDRIMHNSLISNLSFSTERLYESEMRVLTNKKLNKPSDGPVDVLNSLAIREKISEIEQYQRNISRAQTILQNTETIVSQVGEVYQRLNELTIQGASDSYGASDKLSISYEVNQLLEQLLNFANNKSEASYTFGGTNIDAQPYLAIRNDEGEIVEIKTSGTGGDINSMIGENIKIKVNVNGEDLFEDSINLFDVVIQIRDNLKANNTDGVREQLTGLQEGTEKILNHQAIIGSRLNRINAAESRAENDVISFTEFLSNTEDVDASEAVMDYQMDLLTLQYSLQAGSRLMQPKLADFLG
ncbi:MAG: flagellar hook-associated protein FlgL [Candidatus Latescibacteria bacterium]|nr:flagellar hook-associated protein FlgL [Candidatus Latescibacterota bacterium]